MLTGAPSLPAHTWDRRRLSAETIRLLDRHADEVRRLLISDVVPFDDAPALMHDVAARRRHVLTAVFVVDDPA